MVISNMLPLALAGVKGDPFGEEGGSSSLGAGNVPLFTWVVDAWEPQVPWCFYRIQEPWMEGGVLRETGSSKCLGARPGVRVLVHGEPTRMKPKVTCSAEPRGRPCSRPDIPPGTSPAWRRRSAGRKAAAGARERNCGTAPRRWRPGPCPDAGGSESLASPPP